MEKDKLKILNGLKKDNEKIEEKETLFPIEVFPDFYQNFITEISQKQGFSPDLLSAGLMSATCLAVGNKIKIKVKNGWTEAASIFASIIGKPGDGKTPSMNLILKPINEIDQENHRIYLKEKEEFELENSDDNALVTKPKKKQYLMSDFTLEAVFDMHSKTKKGIGLYVDELKGLLGQFNKYRSGNDEEQLLAAFSGSPITINRATKEPLRINTPCISILGGMQPKMINSIFKGNKLNNGFIDRFLFFWPSEFSKSKWSEDEIDLKLIEEYSEKIKSISRFSDSLMDPIEISFAPGIRKFLFKWQNNNQENFESDFERGAVIKLEVYILRFCLILHILKNYPNGKFSEGIQFETAKSAIKLYEYFKSNAMRVYDQIIAEPYDFLDAKHKKLYDLLGDQFQTKDGVLLVKEHKLMSESSLKRFLKDKCLFKKVGHGIYEKIY